jgi:putative transposase
MRGEYPGYPTEKPGPGLQRLLWQPAGRGRKPICRRGILDAIVPVLQTGCPWRQLRHDVPNWKSVATVFWRWAQAGIWQQIHTRLRRLVRWAASKRRPTAAILESQWLQTAGGEERG